MAIKVKASYGSCTWSVAATCKKCGEIIHLAGNDLAGFAASTSQIRNMLCENCRLAPKTIEGKSRKRLKA